MAIPPESLEAVHGGDPLVRQLVVQLGRDQGCGIGGDLDRGYDEDGSRRAQNVAVSFSENGKNFFHLCTKASPVHGSSLQQIE